jgi:hypothetical protein
MPEKLSHGPRTAYDARVGAGLSRGPSMRKKLNAAPWSGTWPAPRATLDLDFANDQGFVRGVGQGRSMDAVTFTRASVGRFVDQDGLLQEAANNEPRFDWASTAQVAQRNLLSYTEQFDNAYWVKETGTTVTANTIIAPDGTTTADKIVCNTSVARVIGIISTNSTYTAGNYTLTVYLQKEEAEYVQIIISSALGGQWVNFDLDAVAVTGGSYQSASIVADSNLFLKATVTFTFTAGTGSVRFRMIDGPTAALNAAYTSVIGNGFYIWGAQLEEGSTATDYQPIAQPTTNTPLAANPTSNGLLIEEARTNRLLWNRDATDAAWVKTDVTAAKDQTGIDGVTNAASSLTSTADNGTCIQTITLASGSRTGSVFLKRITGTGNVQVSLDGSTWSTVDLSDTEWRRIVLSGTVTNPTVGIKLLVSGDAVAMDYGQVEDGAFPTSPILTTSASVTRSADVGNVGPLVFAPNTRKYNKGTFWGQFTPFYSAATPFGNNTGLSMRDSIGNGNLNNLLIQNTGNGNVQWGLVADNFGNPSAIFETSPAGNLKGALSFQGGLLNAVFGGTNGVVSRSSPLNGSSQPLINSFVLGNANVGVGSVSMWVQRVIFISQYTTAEALRELVRTP